MLDFSWFSDDPCFMTKVADEVVNAGNTGTARAAAPRGFGLRKAYASAL